MKDRAASEQQEEEPEAKPTAMHSAQDAEALFREHSDFIAQFLYRLGVPDADLDDVVQEVFLVAHRKGGYQPGPARPRTWLSAIAVRLAAASRRTRGRRREAYGDAALEAAQADGHEPEQAAQIAEALARVQQALDTLDFGHRAALLLYEIEGQSCADIALALDLPVGTVYSRLHHARERFRTAHARLSQERPVSGRVERA